MTMNPDERFDQFDDDEEEIAFIEESVEMSGNVTRDMLASGSNQGIQFQHFEQNEPSPKRGDAAAAEIVQSIPPAFGDYTKKEDTKGGRAGSKAKRPATAKGKKASATSSAQDIENANKAKQRLRDASQKKKKDE
jgi:hypothetical protein